MIPVHPSAADHLWNISRRVIKAIRPARPAAIHASSAVITHAPCRYTIRTLEPRDFSSGPNSARRAIPMIVMKNKARGDLSRDIARFYSTRKIEMSQSICNCKYFVMETRKKLEKNSVTPWLNVVASTAFGQEVCPHSTQREENYE